MSEKTCKCIYWCRDPVGEGWQDKGLPMSTHHPRCHEYKEEKFLRFRIEGQSLLVEEKERAAFESETCKPEEVYMTRDQFEKIPESSGF